MSKNSKIEWTDHTFNPVRGCTKVSPGCEHCYAASMAKRNPKTLGIWGSAGTRMVAMPNSWKEPVKWNRLVNECESCGTRYNESAECDCSGPTITHLIRPRVFCASMADVFEDWKGNLHYPDKTVDGGIAVAWWRSDIGICRAGETTLGMCRGERLATMQDMRDQLFRLIEATPNMDWQLLTKRPENVLRMVPESWRAGFPSNVWMGTTVEDQTRADERIPALIKIPARVRFLSCEPLLGPVDLLHLKMPDGTRQDAVHGLHWHPDSETGDNRAGKVDWVITGGESGPGARPMHPQWARRLRDQCSGTGVAFFFKQWGEWLPSSEPPFGRILFPNRLAIWQWGAGAGIASGDGSISIRVGKKEAGRLLDGVEHSAFPNTAEVRA